MGNEWIGLSKILILIQTGLTLTECIAYKDLKSFVDLIGFSMPWITSTIGSFIWTDIYDVSDILLFTVYQYLCITNMFLVLK